MKKWILRKFFRDELWELDDMLIDAYINSPEGCTDENIISSRRQAFKESRQFILDWLGIKSWVERV